MNMVQGSISSVFFVQSVVRLKNLQFIKKNTKSKKGEGNVEQEKIIHI